MAKFGTKEWYFAEMQVKGTAYDLALEGLKKKGREIDGVCGIDAEAITELKRQYERAQEEYEDAAAKEKAAEQQVFYEQELSRCFLSTRR